MRIPRSNVEAAGRQDRRILVRVGLNVESELSQEGRPNRVSSCSSYSSLASRLVGLPQLKL